MFYSVILVDYLATQTVRLYNNQDWVVFKNVRLQSTCAIYVYECHFVGKGTNYIYTCVNIKRIMNANVMMILFIHWSSATPMLLHWAYRV